MTGPEHGRAAGWATAAAADAGRGSAALLEQVPARAVPRPAGRRPAQDRHAVTGAGCSARRSPWSTPGQPATAAARADQVAGLAAARSPGETWQERWLASGVDRRRRGWTGGRRPCGVAEADRPGRAGQTPRTHASVGRRARPADLRRRHPAQHGLAAGQPASGCRWPARWPASGTPRGFAALDAAAAAAGIEPRSPSPALSTRIAFIIAAKGGTVARHHRRGLPGTAGIRDARDRTARHGGKGACFYQLLHAIGRLPAGRPAHGAHVRAPRTRASSHPTQLIDRYDLACRPVRDLLVDYLRERQPAARLHHPDQPGLPTWACCSGKTSRRTTPASARCIWPPRSPPRGNSASGPRPCPRTAGEAAPRPGCPRSTSATCLPAVRAFYLDIAQWAAEDPARWGAVGGPLPDPRART